MAARNKKGEATPAIVTLQRAGVHFDVHQYTHDPRVDSYGLEAAQALGVDADRVFKTLMVDLDGALVVGIVPVSRSLDLKAVAAVLGGKKALLAQADRAQRATGYVLGGISPVGQKRQHRSALDESAESWPTVFVSGGRRGLDVKVAAGDLRRLIGAVLAPIAR